MRIKQIVGDPAINLLIIPPEIQRNKISTITTEVASFTYAPGTPAPLTGDVVHYEESDGAFYKGDHLVRNNLVGIKDGVGNIVAGGIAKGLSGLIENQIYHLSYPTYASAITQTSDNTSYNLRYNVATYARSQGFLGVAGKMVTQVDLKLLIDGAPTYDIYLELRNDDGTGKPGTTVLATSEHINAASLSTTATIFQFRFLHGAILSATPYHICLQAAESGVDPLNYVAVRGENSRVYASGQMCVSDDADAWTAVDADLYFTIYLADING